MSRQIHAYQISEEDIKEHPEACKHSAHGRPEGFTGIEQQRCVTDIFFLLLIICLWIAISVIGSQAIQQGDPSRLLNPIDDMGKTCGVDLPDKPFLVPVLPIGVGICTSQCSSTSANFTSTNPADYYCLNSVVQQDALQLPGALEAYITQFCVKEGQFSFDSNCGCMIKLESTPVFQRCLPTDENALMVAFGQTAEQMPTFLVNGMKDVYQARHIIFGFGAVAGFVLSFVWIGVLRCECLSKFAIWSTLVLVFVSLVLIGGFILETAKEWQYQYPMEHTQKTVTEMWVAGGVAVALSVAWLVFMIVCGASINLGIRTLALTAECIDSMPLIVFTPVVQAGGLIAVLVKFTF